MYNIQRCYIVQIVLAGVSENAFSLTLDPADILTRSMQILYPTYLVLNKSLMVDFLERFLRGSVEVSKTLHLPKVTLCRLVSVWIHETRSQCFPAVLRHF